MVSFFLPPTEMEYVWGVKKILFSKKIFFQGYYNLTNYKDENVTNKMEIIIIK